MNYKRSLRKILFTGNIKKIKFVKLLCQIQFAQDNYTNNVLCTFYIKFCAVVPSEAQVENGLSNYHATRVEPRNLDR